MADARESEPAAIPRFMATRWGTALKMLFSIALAAFGLAAAVDAHRRGSLPGTGFGGALTASGLWSAVRHAGVLTGHASPRAGGPAAVSIAAFATRDEAESAAAQLRAMGVRSVVVSDGSIVVHARDAERARLLMGVPPPAEM